MTKLEDSLPEGSSGDHGWTEAVRSLFQSIDKSTEVLNLVLTMVRWLIVVLTMAVVAFTIGSTHSGCTADARERQLDELAGKLEAMRLQMVTVQATADSTKDSVEVIEDRPTLDLEVVDAQPSASDGPAQPTALVVIRKPRQSANQQPSVLFAVPLPSVPSGAAPPEPKR